MWSEQDDYWMQYAIKLAHVAEEKNEVPVGAILVSANQIIGEGYNCPITTCDPTAHAEMRAIRQAAWKVENYRLINTTLYVTLEPCLMCAGAIIHARVKRLVYAARDEKAGAIESQENIFAKSFLNHHVDYQGGLQAAYCGKLLSSFFQKRR